MYVLRAFCAALLFTAAISVVQLPAAATVNANSAAFAFVQELGDNATKGLTNPANSEVGARSALPPATE